MPKSPLDIWCFTLTPETAHNPHSRDSLLTAHKFCKNKQCQLPYIKFYFLHQHCTEQKFLFWLESDKHVDGSHSSFLTESAGNSVSETSVFCLDDLCKTVEYLTLWSDSDREGEVTDRVVSTLLLLWPDCWFKPWQNHSSHVIVSVSI